MEISRLIATFLVIIWLIYFSKAIFTVISGVIKYLIIQPIKTVVELLFR